MKDKDKVILIKMLKYIKELLEFIDGYTYDTFNQDKRTIYACVFNLSQIGELANKVSDDLVQQNPRN